MYRGTKLSLPCVRGGVTEGDGGVVGALRKHAGGMFLASDLGSYAAVASIWIFAAPS